MGLRFISKTLGIHLQAHTKMRRCRCSHQPRKCIGVDPDKIPCSQPYDKLASSNARKLA
jgi:hypothetical protein